MIGYARQNAVALLLAGSVIASGGLLLGLGSRLSFLLDDWTFLVYRPGFDAATILAPHNEHIAAGPLLAYKAVLATFGMDSALPFRVVSTSIFLLSAVLLFFLLRRRLGEWPALAATTLVLFLGAAWEDLLWPFQLGYFASMAAGLGMLLALERGGRRADPLACGLLVVALAFSSVGLPFAAGAAVHVLQQPERLRRAYVVAVPVGLFALWYLGYGREAQTSVTAGNVATAPLFLFDGVASSISSLLGLAAPRDEAAVNPLYWGRSLLAVALLGAAWRLRALGGPSRWLVVFVVIMATFWMLAGASEQEARTATTSRYQYLGAVFVLLVAAELLRGWTPSRRAIAALCVVTLAAIGANVSYLHGAYQSYRQTTVLEQAGLGALEIARDRVAPGLTLTEELVETEYVHVEAGPYLAAVDEHGSPAYSPSELLATPEPARQAADRVLAAAFGAAITPTGGAQLSADRDRCRVARPSPGAPALLHLPRGGASLRAPVDSVTELRLRRFAVDSFPVRLDSLRGGSATLALPPDRSEEPWELELRGSEPVEVCALSPAGS